MYHILPNDIPEIESLATLALDLRWSWNHEADCLWQQLDPVLWQLTHNPWVVLQTVSKEQLKTHLADHSFKTKVDELIKLKAFATQEKGWFQQAHPNSKLNCVAYFSMEYMVSEALPIYVGGLGNVAGDQLKAASDLGVPVTGIGLLYGHGYFRQQLDKDGSQLALYTYNDPGQLPITPLRLPNGEWLRIKIPMPGYAIWLRAWQVQVGKCTLYLLDSNDAANLPWYRGITNEIYGGDEETRIKQDMVLGIGGWKLLRQLNLQPEVCHLNEGHAAFLVLERAADFMKKTGLSFRQALAVTRAGNVFTTHTAVAAGFDRFAPQLMQQYLSVYATEELHISLEELLSLGRQIKNNQSEYFNMAYLAIRGSRSVNGVSELHGCVSRRLFQPLFKRWPANEVPVGAVTNGVHMPSWDSQSSDEVWTKACGKNRWKGDLGMLEQQVKNISVEDLWAMRVQSKQVVIHFIRERFARQHIVSNQPEMMNMVNDLFDPNILTLGFARRFVAYKRPTLLLHNEERLKQILTNKDYPVQLIIAGKAPPYDDEAKILIKEWIQFIDRHNLQKHVIFLSDYDMLLTENLVQGVDVWINTPRRPFEACGTSGMKVLVNGGLNLSELDGWWAEAFNEEAGWSIGDGQEHDADPGWDAAEADNLYHLIEHTIIPLFYQHRCNGIPVKWVEKMRNSMATLAPKYSANRTVREYTEKYYLTAAQNYLTRAAHNGVSGKRITAAENELKEKWNGVYFKNAITERIADGYTFLSDIFLNGISADKILVELYADAKDDHNTERLPMQLQELNGDYHIYKLQVCTSRPASDYTIRIIADYENIAVPLENDLILWQR